MVIYNRWLIFETSDYSGGWDGKDESAGVYSWVISNNGTCYTLSDVFPYQ